MSRKHTDRFMREIQSVEMVTGTIGRETLWPCLHVVTRRQTGKPAKRRRCLECAGAHYSSRLPFRETWPQRLQRITRRINAAVEGWRRRAAV